MPPLLMEPVEALIQLKGDPIGSLRPVDIYGVPREQQVPVKNNIFELNGLYQTYYYEIRR
jgi:hypothetical protein